MKVSGIYKIESKIKPERIYIGSAVNIAERWCKHVGSLQKNKHENSKLQRHFNKYGKADLHFSVLLGCEKEDLIKTEQYFIDSYNPYFNICKIAGSCLGVKHSKEYCEKLIGNQYRLGKDPWNKGKKGVYSEETLKVMDARKEGGKASDETKRKMRRTRTSETKQKLRDAAKKRYYSEEWKQQCKDVWEKRKLNKICTN